MNLHFFEMAIINMFFNISQCPENKSVSISWYYIRTTTCELCEDKHAVCGLSRMCVCVYV